MADSIWLQACFITPPMMFGRRLKPFSVAHRYILKHLRNPYIVGGKCARQDLLLGVYVCSLTWEQIKILIASDGAWGKRAAIWAWFWRNANFLAMSAQFEQYLEEFQAVADRSTPADEPPQRRKATSIACPLEWHLVTVLMQELHLSESDAWNMAFNRARCYFDVVAERNGDDSLLSEYDMQLSDLREKAEACYKAGDLDGMARWDDKTQELINQHRQGRI